MLIDRRTFLLLSSTALIIRPAFSQRLTGPADVIHTGGAIVTLDDAQPSAEALAVKEGRILAVGSRADVEAGFKGQDTKVVDLTGKILLPGFIDPHSHYINSLLVANQAQVYAPPSGPGKDVESIIATIKEFDESRKIPKGELIIAYGYDDSVMPDGRLLNRDDLDAAFPDNPVRVDHVSMHGTVLSSFAMKKYCYSADTKAPPGGVIVRKEGTNEPYGLIMETAYLPVNPSRPTRCRPSRRSKGRKPGRCSMPRPGSPLLMKA
jgi:predicted amidohydrolase YtcJ